jgi:hypothetical protein
MIRISMVRTRTDYRRHIVIIHFHQPRSSCFPGTLAKHDTCSRTATTISTSRYIQELIEEDSLFPTRMIPLRVDSLGGVGVRYHASFMINGSSVHDWHLYFSFLPDGILIIFWYFFHYHASILSGCPVFFRYLRSAIVRCKTYKSATTSIIIY